ncbi:16S rRNA (uracil(1498)-N(3))-methyltransferase [Varunaivibrio sulfuroxidans]|uniref:Ribosomal RNA small subunit methyltransferase E n=1 Tax=Varunaivibrio sulfuroxidans TaxID=1773489 RepID=A0A4R3J6Z2_9PROT|nr:16S rRNA (uracil(1498)-N(3))-methyltransferase [Varunaivibrio sulfuroxidans]TCS60643.1 16S rRNA (uracil1498-N3)-methyltransferase [Varunaivibrio sulfuroxidans]WES30132.1 16S rRNA (uracil(1498)-N(3))-methyltransferase [Varunaivibrio sulfuroxidans]
MLTIMDQTPRPKFRLFVDTALTAGARVALDHEQSHYLKNVMRAGKNAPVALFNGRDGEWLGELAALGKHHGEVAILRQMHGQRREPNVRLIFAPLKKARLDFLVEKSVELGVSRLSPVITRHTDVGRVNVARLRAQAREAAEQCERLTLPTVDAPIALAQLLDQWERLPVGAPPLFAAVERLSAPPIAQALQNVAEVQERAFLIGPEGGFSRDEVALLDKAPFVFPVSLGPRILRAETAALVALACHLMLSSGDACIDDATDNAPSST